MASVLLCLWVWSIHQTISQPEPVSDGGGEMLKVIEFNILGSNRHGAEIARWLERENADLVYALESPPIVGEISALSDVYPYRAGCGELVSDCDLMVMSKYPLEDAGFRSMGAFSGDRFFHARIEINGSAVNIVAMHLTKPYFDALQRQELIVATRWIRGIEGPVILAGDFNSSLLSPDIQNFMMATGLRSYAREPRTWPVGAWSLGLPIDHVLVRPPVHIKSLRRVEDNMGSNHYGLAAEIVLPSAVMPR
nr:endonuclease/exonuclease/phosphatase family protein [Marinicella sp. W31]MDC2875948.1 endonuclease/exonuclease/phosphatase family protein [Marinicella sp. W31]